MQRRIRLVQPAAELADFFRQRCNVLTGCLGFTNRFGARVALSPEFLDLDLKRLALRFEREKTLTVEDKAPPR